MHPPREVKLSELGEDDKSRQKFKYNNTENESKDSVTMRQSLVELQLPPDIYERAQQIASESNRSIESVLLDSLAFLFGTSDSHISIDDLKNYSDQELWVVINHRLTLTQDTRLRQLVEHGKQAQLSIAEQTEMEHLLDLVDHQMLLRSEALLLLKQRGHNIDQTLKLGA